MWNELLINKKGEYNVKSVYRVCDERFPNMNELKIVVSTNFIEVGNFMWQLGCNVYSIDQS